MVFALQNIQHAGKVDELRMHLLATVVIEEASLSSIYIEADRSKDKILAKLENYVTLPEHIFLPCPGKDHLADASVFLSFWTVTGVAIVLRGDGNTMSPATIVTIFIVACVFPAGLGDFDAPRLSNKSRR